MVNICLIVEGDNFGGLKVLTFLAFSILRVIFTQLMYRCVFYLSNECDPVFAFMKDILSSNNDADPILKNEYLFKIPSIDIRG
jgi:hypothetical protein